MHAILIVKVVLACKCLWLGWHGALAGTPAALWQHFLPCWSAVALLLDLGLQRFFGLDLDLEGRPAVEPGIGGARLGVGRWPGGQALAFDLSLVGCLWCWTWVWWGHTWCWTFFWGLALVLDLGLLGSYQSRAWACNSLFLGPVSCGACLDFGPEPGGAGLAVGAESCGASVDVEPGTAEAPLVLDLGLVGSASVLDLCLGFWPWCWSWVWFRSPWCWTWVCNGLGVGPGSGGAGLSVGPESDGTGCGV